MDRQTWYNREQPLAASAQAQSYRRRRRHEPYFRNPRLPRQPYNDRDPGPNSGQGFNVQIVGDEIQATFPQQPAPAIVSDRLLMNNPTITTHAPQTNLTVMITPPSSAPARDQRSYINGPYFKPRESRPSMSIEQRTDINTPRDEAPRGGENHNSLGNEAGEAIRHDYTIGRSNTAYERQLISHPLWAPQPNMLLPAEFRQKGISIGDVGIITSTGQFDFLFNICLPPNHPINPPQLPEGFKTLELSSTDVQVIKEFANGSHLCSPCIQKKALSFNDRREGTIMSFEAENATEGAVLVMPDGAYQVNAYNLTTLREYMARHLEGWYRFTNGPRGREAKNGDIRLVVGCDKSPSWGIGCFSYSRSSGARLKLALQHDTGQNPSCDYKWEQTSPPATFKAGPDLYERQGLQSINQCLFLRTFNALLADDVWAMVNPLPVPAQNAPGFGNPQSPIGNSSSLGSSPDYSSNGSLGRSSSSPNSGTLVDGDNVFESSRHTKTIHPSYWINEQLLRSASETVKMAITHDFVWCNALNNSSQEFCLEIVLGICNALFRRIRYGIAVGDGKNNQDDLNDLKKHIQTEMDLDFRDILNRLESEAYDIAITGDLETQASATTKGKNAVSVSADNTPTASSSLQTHTPLNDMTQPNSQHHTTWEFPMGCFACHNQKIKCSASDIKEHNAPLGCERCKRLGIKCIPYIHQFATSSATTSATGQTSTSGSPSPTKGTYTRPKRTQRLKSKR
ncbi:hypothetical protein CVT24_007656 [Panaeolus cyanescens]|uniref:Zn(2)-C6 fungal-type domain-containing protein n=1 Tax=Panaeolus cyanescens TaxID=181874 RepID=A0A409W9Q7_9AGAR|nr:hypothetical protein CVT24_007656 [Panaeolus cyanescens]